jgi:hypothetical protein
MRVLLVIGVVFIAQAAFAGGGTVRDHRGQTSNAVAPMHLKPTRGNGYAGLQGPDYGKGKPPAGPTIRDHRNSK